MSGVTAGWKVQGIVSEVEPGTLNDGTRFDNVYLSLGRETVSAFLMGPDAPAIPGVGETVEYVVRPQIKAGNGVPRLSVRIIEQLSAAKVKAGASA